MGESWRARLRRVYGQAPDIWSAYLSYALSFVRRRHHVVAVWPESRIELGERVALLTHFDRRQRVPDHVKAYIRELHVNGFSTVFISNSGRLHEDSLTVLRSLCRAVIVRRNVGYDFGAIREVLDLLDLPRPETEQVLIANDSVYGPLLPIADMLARVDFDQADIWGLTDSWQYRYHLQSFFLLAGRRAITSPAWRKFWRGVRQVSSKHWVVPRYEVGLTQQLLKAGLRCRALWRYHELLERTAAVETTVDRNNIIRDPLEQMRAEATRRIREAAAAGRPLNPTSDLWRQLLLTGCPFLKIELLRANPTKVPDIVDWRAVVSSLPGGDVAMIERDLQLQPNIRNRAP
jgi:Rhamnan synthesis protein F